MKLIIIVASVLTLVSCSAIDTSRIAPGYVQAFYAIKNATLGTDNSTITPELIKNIPYASMLVKIGNGPYGLMILESVNDDKSTWVSADGIYFVIKNGRIIKSQGLNNNLTQTSLPYFFTSESYLKESLEKQIKFYYSYDKPYLSSLEISANYDIGKSKSEDLLMINKDLREVKEKITNDQIRWKAVNKYWIDDEGYVWKSEQTISPKVPKIYLEVTKKPSL